MQFIGGFTANQVIKTGTILASKRGIIPILDYARESSMSVHDVVKYKAKIDALADCISTTPSFYNSQKALAIKPSSFYPSQTHVDDIHHMILNFHWRARCNIFMFDAEDSKNKQREDHTFDLLLGKLQDDSASHDFHLLKTIQAYRKDSVREVDALLNRSSTSPVLGVKLVRGAYWRNDPDVFYTDKRDTDKNYDKILRLLLESKVPLCIATHNSASIELAKSMMTRTRTIQNQVYFAQLLGMADGMTRDLTNAGYSTMKYVPYGEPCEMAPYLFRRLLENYPILQHAFRV